MTHQLAMFGIPPSEIPPPTPPPYQGTNISVREVHHRNGRTSYGLYRPWSRERSIIYRCYSMEHANHIAEYIDTLCGGSFRSEHRQAAQKDWEMKQHEDQN